ncbi:MAG: carboxypeptidase-like regulatory domain-containing protein, partial [Verrucomicrobiota bacterium]
MLHAQSVVLTGALGGRITDKSGAATVGAEADLRSLDTGVKFSTDTNQSGLYRFQALTPGSYAMTARLKGFRDAEALVRVQVGNTTWQEFKLQVGAGTDTVTVSGREPMLRPAESSNSTVLDRSFIQDLPLNGRRYTDFTLLTPNTNPDGDTGLVSVAGQQGGEDSGYANGNGSNSFTVDGTNATSNYFADILGRYRIPYLYGENAIQEFQVAISPY